MPLVNGAIMMALIYHIVALFSLLSTSVEGNDRRLTFDRSRKFKLAVFTDLHFGEASHGEEWAAWGPQQVRQYRHRGLPLL